MKVNSVNKSIILILIILCLTSFFASCKKKTTEVIVFDDSHPLALAPDVEWAVVTEPYAVFKESDEWGAATAGHCRKGELVLL